MCGGGSNWFGWSNSHTVGVASYILVGSGTATLVFGNCWNGGSVGVYLDSKEVARAVVGETSKTVVIPYTKTSTLEVKDEDGNAVMQILSFKVECSQNSKPEDRSNPFVVDVVVTDLAPQGAVCSTAPDTIGASVQIGKDCFTHVHPDTLGVFDASFWVGKHDGNLVAFEASGRNPISRFAEMGLHELSFPASHSMSRWQQKRKFLHYVGRFGDDIPFSSLQSELQTLSLAKKVGADTTEGETSFEACGSAGEVSNEPLQTNRYLFGVDTFTGSAGGSIFNNQLDFYYHFNEAKSMVWLNVVFKAKDQLRQRMAWALSQIFVIGAPGLTSQERGKANYFGYYDIMVRHAFGNYRDVMKEMSRNRLMADYLTFYQNKAQGYSKTYPDENFAREFMQLHSIGLWQLEADGTKKVDSQGNHIPTYSNDDVQAFARVWTGSDSVASRGRWFVC